MKATVVIVLLGCILGLCAGAAWNRANAPSIMGSGFKFNLMSLPLNATLKQTPWSDTYWPSYESGIAHRWNLNTPNDFNYKLLSLNALANATTDTMEGLSPAEKYDIYMGRYDYPTVKAEWQRTSPQDATWEGLCHGWSPAAYSYEQPNPVTLTNKDNITIPFGSSDVKALLIYFLAEYAEGFDTNFSGRRCNTDIDAYPEKADIPECADINAGAYHVIIANLLSTGKSFVVDRDRGIQVWNQPLLGYSATIGDSRPPSNNSAPGTVKEVHITMLTTWVGETYPAWKPHPAHTATLHFGYWVELDQSGNIIGGSYSTYERADFVWRMMAGSFSGYFSAVATIYNQSINGNEGPRRARSFSELAEAATPMAAATGNFASTKTAATGMYPSDNKESWLIAPESATSIEISFSSFETERYKDKVRVFECNAQTQEKGALLAVLHGNNEFVPEGHKVTVNASCAYVTFTTDDLNNAQGFAATYIAH